MNQNRSAAQAAHQDRRDAGGRWQKQLLSESGVDLDVGKNRDADDVEYDDLNYPMLARPTATPRPVPVKVRTTATTASGKTVEIESGQQFKDWKRGDRYLDQQGKIWRITDTFERTAEVAVREVGARGFLKDPRKIQANSLENPYVGSRGKIV